MKDVHLSLFKVDSAIGNYVSAIAHLQQGNLFKDSMYNITRRGQTEELNIKYQTEEKEKDLKIARNSAKLEQVQLEQTRVSRNWIIAGSGLLVVIAGMVYRQSRLRQKNNRIITQQNNLITQKNVLLEHLITEKEWLLKEVHHRVKNNLHTVICLLESQARYLENDALLAIEKSQHRIYAMSLIHQKLYQSHDIKTIDMSVYIPELVQSLKDSFDTPGNIEFNLDIARVKLDISHAIPLGLIINEAVTNSIKYAFPDGGKGEISIFLTENNELVMLTLADNGVGIPKIDSDTEPESLGLRLIKGLTEDIDAQITFEINNGTRISIVFRSDLLTYPKKFTTSFRRSENAS